MAGAAHWIQRSDRWYDLIATGPISVPRELLDIPGIRYVEPSTTNPSPTWRLEVPATAWMLPAVAAVLPPRTKQQPLVPSWPGLYPHQATAVQFLLENRGGLLADVVGLGKTRPAAVSSHLFARRTNRPVLVCGTKYLRETWRYEVAQVFGSEVRFHALEGAAAKMDSVLPDAEFYFCHYDIIKGWWSQLSARLPAAVIFDEAHLLRNSRTHRTKAAQLAASVAPMRTLLTGTPVLNRPGEIFPLLELATGRYTWGRPSDFRTRYAGAHTTEHGLVDTTPTRVDEFRARTANCLLRRTEQDVGIKLPPARRELITADLNPAMAAKYTALFDGHSPAELVEAILERRGSNRTIEWLGKLRAVASDSKLETTQGLVQSLVAQGEKVVVFSWRRQTAERLGDLVVHGGYSQAARDATIQQFQAAQGPHVLSATYDALSTGVTLDSARMVVLHDLSWVPGDMLQAAGRVTGGLRRGEKHCVEHWVVARGTLDDLIIKIAGAKGETIEQLVADAGAQNLAAFFGYQPNRHSYEKLLMWARSV